MGRTFLGAPAENTSSGAITNSQTTVTLGSTAAFGAPNVLLPTSVVILDSGAPGFDKNNPYATNYEYQLVTGNNMGTNTLTFNNGVRGNYAGTTPKAFSAGATVAATTLPEDYTAAFSQQIAVLTPSGNASSGSITIPSWCNHLTLRGQGRSDAAAAFADVQVFFNGDNTLANYAYVQLVGNNAAASSANAGSIAWIARIPAATAIANDGGTFTIEIFNPQGTTFYHEAHGINASYEGAGGSSWYNIFRTVHWSSTAALTSVALVLASGLWVTGSRIEARADP